MTAFPEPFAAMPLFDVPGWTVNDEPVAESSNTRKRKRPASESETSLLLHSAEVNLEKLVKKLTGSKRGGKERQERASREEESPPKNPLPTKSHKSKASVDVVDKKKIISHPMPLKSAAERRESSLRPTKKVKTKRESSPFEEIQIDEPEEVSDSTGLTSLQKSMKQSLDGARFR